MPGHNHTVASSGSHNHKATTASSGSHTHTISGNASDYGESDVHAGGDGRACSYTTGSAGSHTHSITVSSSGSHSHTLSSAGGDGSHNILTPYTAIYIWRRTA